MIQVLLSQLGRLSLQREKEKMGQFSILSILENIFNLSKEGVRIAGLKSELMPWLVRNSIINSQNTFNELRLYASELLAIILGEEECQEKFVELGLIEILLQFLGSLNQHTNFFEDEKETIENLFDVLILSLNVGKGQNIFIENEGIELMLKLVKKKDFYSLGGFRVIERSVEGNSLGSRYFVDNMGLKYLFPIFMRKALKTRDPEQSKSITKTCVGMILNLLIYNDEQYRQRVIMKLKEKNYEKLQWSFEIRGEIMKDIQKVLDNKEKTRVAFDINDEKDLDQVVYVEKVEAGYVSLLQIDYAILFSCSKDAEIKAMVLKICEHFEIDLQNLFKNAQELIESSPNQDYGSLINLEKLRDLF